MDKRKKRVKSKNKASKLRNEGVETQGTDDFSSLPLEEQVKNLASFIQRTMSITESRFKRIENYQDELSADMYNMNNNLNVVMKAVNDLASKVRDIENTVEDVAGYILDIDDVDDVDDEDGVEESENTKAKNEASGEDK